MSWWDRLKAAVADSRDLDFRSNLLSLFFRTVGRFHPTYTVNDGRNRFRFRVNSVTSLYRARVLLEKERDTIEWIDSFEPGSVFYDIGANVGAFTVYAGVARQARVYAFEPAFHNFYLLNHNVILNGLDRVEPFNLAFAESDHKERIYMKTVLDGDAGVNLGESMDCNREAFDPAHVQMILAFSLDSFIEKYAADFPNHIKIDVDGLEPQIIRGAAKTLADPRLESMLIEVDEGDPANLEMIAAIEAAGFEAHKSELATYQAVTFINVIFRRR